MLVLAFGFSETRIPIRKKQWGFASIIKKLKIPIAAAMCYAFIEISIASFMSLYLDEININGTALGIVFTFFAIGGAVSPYPAGKIADRIGKIKVLRFCGYLLLSVMFSLNFTTNYWSICTLIFLVGIVAGALYPIALSMIADIVSPEKMGTANASFSFFYGVGCIAGPLVTGWILEFYTITSLFYPMTVSALLFVIITSLSHENTSRNSSSTPHQ
jgi:MFS family permease